jgi:hypothetical protein
MHLGFGRPALLNSEYRYSIEYSPKLHYLLHSKSEIEHHGDALRLALGADLSQRMPMLFHDVPKSLDSSN